MSELSAAPALDKIESSQILRGFYFAFTCCAWLALPPLESRAITITATSPERHIINADPAADIVVTFDEAFDPLSITPATVQLFGRWSGPAAGTLQLESGNTQIRFTPDEPFFCGEWVSVSLSRGITNTSADSLLFGYTWGFWTACERGAREFTFYAEIPVRFLNEGHIQTYGAYAGDLNNDGWSDLALPNEKSNDVRVFLNDGTGDYTSFTPFSLVGGNAPSPSEGADFDLDGEIDIAVGNAGNSQLSVLFGDGSGSLSAAQNYTSGAAVRGVGVGDLDGDGDADIVTANRSASSICVFLNQGDGTFVSSGSFDAGLSGETALALIDINNDGILDFFVGAIFSKQMGVWLGDGAGGFAHSFTRDNVGASWMIAPGDVNGDGFVDIVSANSSDNNVSVLLGDGAGGLGLPKTYPTGAFPLAIDLGDIDADGDLDMISSNYADGNYTQYENTGAGLFSFPKTYPAKSAGSCAILHDRDNDGDLDATFIDEIDDYVLLYNNGCCETAGDADGSKVITIGDATYTIAHIFSGGPPSDCNDEMDANGTNSINIGDVTRILAWIFTGGAAPVCGKTGH